MHSDGFRVEDLSADTVGKFQNRLLEWGRNHLRTFFWRERELEPYESLVVEILLARTRAESVEPVARQFLDRYPTPSALRAAKKQDVEDLLRPLGLFRKRAGALLDCARQLVENFGGKVPDDVEDLQGLPYVGRYAANAILCFGLERPRPVVDSNVARVFRRYFELREPKPKLGSDDLYWAVAGRLAPKENVRLYNWSLLDLGAEICTPRSPDCEKCPMAKGCRFPPNR
jgi:A/G-specific adenine glycosylase